MNLETYVPLAMAIIGALVVFALGYGVGRRSGYDDVDVNLGKPKTAGLPESVEIKGWVMTDKFGG